MKDAVQHLTQANYQIKDLHHQFTHKVIYLKGENLELKLHDFRLMNLRDKEKK